MPSIGVYFVAPSRIAAIAASLIASGVSKSGSPVARLMTSRPSALRRVASASTTPVGEGLTRAMRSETVTLTRLPPQYRDHVT